jgi:hypothetical protein
MNPIFQVLLDWRITGFLGTSLGVMTEVIFSHKVATDKRRNGQFSGGAVMGIAFFIAPFRTTSPDENPPVPTTSY